MPRSCGRGAVHPLRLGQPDAVVPHRLALGTIAGGGVGEDEAPDRAREPQRHGHADQTPHGNADEVRLRDAQRLQEAVEVVGHLLEGVGAGGYRGAAVPAHVVTEDVVAVPQRGRLRVPQVEIGGEGVAERDDRRVDRTLDIVLDGDPVRGDLHRLTSTRARCSRDGIISRPAPRQQGRASPHAIRYRRHRIPRMLPSAP